MHSALHGYVDRIDDPDGRMKPFTIAFCGEFSAGKTSILNAILGGGYALPTGINPVTRVLTRIRYGEALRCYYMDGGAARSLSGARAQALIRGEEPLPDGCCELTLELPSRALRGGIEFVDTPGFNDEMGGELERMSREAAFGADYVVFCANATLLATEFQRAFLDELEARMGNFCLAVNRMDSLNTEEDMQCVREKALWMMDGRGDATGFFRGDERIFRTVGCGRWATLGGLDIFLGGLPMSAVRTATARRAGQWHAALARDCLRRKREQGARLTRALGQLIAARRDAEQLAQHAARLNLARDLQACRLAFAVHLEAMRRNTVGKLAALRQADRSDARVAAFPAEAMRIIEEECGALLNAAARIECPSQKGAPVRAARALMGAVPRHGDDDLIPTPKPKPVKRRGAGMRLLVTLTTLALYDRIEIDSGIDMEYGAYHLEAVERVERRLIPAMKEAWERGLDGR